MRGGGWDRRETRKPRERAPRIPQRSRSRSHPGECFFPPSPPAPSSLSRGCSDSRQFLLKHRTVDPAFSRPLGLSLGLIPLFVPRCYKPLQSMFSSHLPYSGYVLTASPLLSTLPPFSLHRAVAPPSFALCLRYRNLPIYIYFLPSSCQPLPVDNRCHRPHRPLCRLSLDSYSYIHAAM